MTLKSQVYLHNNIIISLSSSFWHCANISNTNLYEGLIQLKNLLTHSISADLADKTSALFFIII